MSDNTDILSIFDTESQSEAGAWLHLTVPGTGGELAYADAEKTKPLRIKTKGPQSDTWTAFQRKVMQQGKDSRTTAEVKRDDAKLLARMTLETENIPKVSTDDRDSVFTMYLNYGDIRSQVIKHVMKAENFIGKAESE